MDEKICPYCAETIKKTAIFCKYCKSKLDKNEVNFHSKSTNDNKGEKLEGVVERVIIKQEKDKSQFRSIVASVFLIGSMLVSNPTMDDYERFVKRTTFTEMNINYNGGFVGQIIGQKITQELVYNFMVNNVNREDFILFSTYKVDTKNLNPIIPNPGTIKFFGIYGQFISY